MEKIKRHYVIGTAGHIDHGKTMLVKNLTGKDTDWLKEEKERGMTIDLGFAFLGDDITIIDVPGHEKFIRNMVAGVSTIDLVLFVIAADDGVMPQTREHLDILRLLQISQGIVVITKVDLVDSDWLELIIEDVKNLVRNTFLEDASIVTVSNETGKGIDQLKSLILKMIKNTPDRLDKGIFRMPIDRIFTIKGFGTIVAGTVLSGRLSVDQTVELLPHRKKLRVRGLQIHEHDRENVKIGDRAAVNLVGIEKDAIHRGDVLAEPDFFHPSRFFDAKFYLLKSAPRSLKHNDRIRLHIGTNEVIGRVSVLDKEEIYPGDGAYVQLRMEKAVVADIRDRFVVRTYSPLVTIGGGIILDIQPKRHKRFSEKELERIKIFETNDPEKIIEQILIQNGFEFISIEEIAKRAVFKPDAVHRFIQALMKKEKCISHQEKGQQYFIHEKYYAEIKKKILHFLQEYHRTNPTRRGVSRNNLKVELRIKNSLLFNAMLDELLKSGMIVIQDNWIASADHKIQVSNEQKNLMEKIVSHYFEEGFTTSNPDQVSEKLALSVQKVNEIISILLEKGDLIKIDEGIFIHRNRILEAQEKLISFFNNHKTLTVGEFRQILNTSRKYAVPLLNYFDSLGLTVRQHDVRVMNKDFD